MMTVQLAIDGMSCGHCVARVKKALEQVPGATVADVAVGSATVEIDPARTSADALVKAVDDAGYPARVAS
ncbi:MAG: heavy-metal-associated domain-containing protein [Vicinamibacteraceae bacterium]|nr:heavy-metal-associated domain-containing protein [Vicinamibacteraceae bacterium]